MYTKTKGRPVKVARGSRYFESGDGAWLRYGQVSNALVS